MTSSGFSNLWAPTPLFTRTQTQTLFETQATFFSQSLKKMGINVPKHAAGARNWNRFMTYAMKRARSNHPHNARWKPLLEAYLTAQVAEKLTAES